MTDGRTDGRTIDGRQTVRDHNKALVGWLVVLRIYVASVVLQPYRDFEAGDNQSLKVQVARPE